MENEAIVERVRELVTPLLESRRTELVELTCRCEGSRVILKFLVDTPQGVTLEDLSALNRAIGDLLDEKGVVEGGYLLEVSSPGLDRPLKTAADFERVISRRLKLFLSVPVQSKMEYSGRLLSAGEEQIVLMADNGQKVGIPLVQIAKAVQEVKL